MNVSLTKELEELVNTKVSSGRYTSASEVIRAGLRLLEHEEAVRAEKLKRLRKEISKGVSDLKSGRSVELDIADIKKRGRDRLAQKRRTA